MNIVDIKEEDDVTLCVRVEFSEGRRALVRIHRSSLKDVHQGQPFRRAEAGAAIVHNAFSSDVLCSYFIHTATARENLTKMGNVIEIITAWLSMKWPNLMSCIVLLAL